ncbi:asparaginase [Mycoplasmatota bacterium]|nr:asparaginase [Mycoplasmatota bacterium]
MKKTIQIIFTGGTISMQRHAINKQANIIDNRDDLLQNIKNELSQIEIRLHQYSLKPSPSITPGDMLNLAKLSKSFLDDPTVDGVVITHGTDTLEESAYFLDLYLRHEKPVVFTGSMRSYSDLGFDGLSNLLSSILVAADSSSMNMGVLVCLNDEINTAREVTKSHTLALDTFKSLEFGPIGIIEQDNVIYTRNTHLTIPNIQPKDIEPNVALIKVASGMSSDLLNLLVDTNVKGIVIEALGRGNVPPQMIGGITRAIENNIPVLLTSRCPIGRVLDNYGYEGGGYHLHQLGVIFTKNLNGQKARIQLMLALGLSHDIETIKKYF